MAMLQTACHSRKTRLRGLLSWRQASRLTAMRPRTRVPTRPRRSRGGPSTSGPTAKSAKSPSPSPLPTAKIVVIVDLASCVNLTIKSTTLSVTSPNGEHLAKSRAKWLIVSCAPFALHLADAELARYVE